MENKTNSQENGGSGFNSDDNSKDMAQPVPANDADDNLSPISDSELGKLWLI